MAPPTMRDEFVSIWIRTGKNPMTKTLLCGTAFLLIVSGASAQQAQRHDPGCARDVSRYCRAQMNDGDMVILSCLKQNRARLSKTCEKVLTDHGQ